MKNAAHHGIRKTLIASFLVLGVLLPSLATDAIRRGIYNEQWGYIVTSNHTVTIRTWLGGKDYRDEVVVPGVIEGLPVTRIENWANWDLKPDPWVPDWRMESEGLNPDNPSDRELNCGRLVIDGKGNMVIGGAAFVDDTLHELVLRGVKEIESNHANDSGAFRRCKNLVRVIADDALEIVDGQAFFENPNLESLTGATNLKRIGHLAFASDPKLKDVPVSEKLEHIGGYAFLDCTSITNVVFPNSLTGLAEHAFRGCDFIEEVTFGSGLKTITGANFNSKPRLRKITIPEGVEAIAGQAFEGCSVLPEVVFPDSLRDPGYWSFQYCPAITNIVIGKNGGMAYVPGAVFSAEMPNLDTVTINGNGETVINGKGGAFNSFKMRHLVLNGVKTIEDTNSGGAFRNCTNLVSVAADGALEHVGVWAFAGCTALTNVEGFRNVMSIGSEAFAGCTSLPTISLAPTLGTIAGGAFEGCSSLCEVVIPDSVTNIGGWAFKDCLSITNIVIGRGMAYVPDSRFSYEMPNLDTVTINGNGETVINGKGGAFNGFKMRHLVLNGVKTIEDTNSGGAFRNCTNLVSVAADGALEHVGVWAFAGCTALTTLEGFQNVTSIGRGAFEDCSSLPTINVPSNVGTIDSGAFARCTSATTVVIPDSVTDLGGGAFQDCTAIRSVSLGKGLGRIGEIIPENADDLDTVVIDGNGETIVAANAFTRRKMRHLVLKGVKSFDDGNGGGAFSSCTNLQTVVADESLARIGAWTFSGCTALTSVEGVTAVTSIGWSAFKGCTSLPELPDFPILADLGGNGAAFSGCTSMTNAVIPDTVTNMNDWTFSNCTGLRSITLGKGWSPIVQNLVPQGAEDLDTIIVKGNGETVIAGGAFFRCKMRHLMMSGVKTIDGACKECPNLEDVVADEALETIGEETFRACPKLRSVTGITGVKVIGNSAFGNFHPERGCPALAEIELPEGLEIIGECAFANCTNLTDVTVPDTVTNVGWRAWMQCHGLKDFTFGAGLNPIPGGLFDWFEGAMDVLTINGDGTTAIADGAFSGMKIDRAVLNGVAKVGSTAFQNNTMLTEVYFDGDAPVVGANAFASTPTNCTAYVPYGSTGWGVDIPLTGTADWNYDGNGHFIKIAYANALSGDVGAWLRFDLVNDLGLEIPTNVNYAAGDKVTVKVEGLPKGLKLVTTQQKETTGRKAVTNVIYTIEGVPTEAIDFATRPMYARVTVTYKDKTKGDKGKVESLQPIPLSIMTPEPTVLTAGVLNEVYEPVDIAELWPEVKDAKVNPTEWSFKGWPTGIKYTTKDVTKKNKDKSVTTNAVAYSVYGQPTKAGDFTITATHSHKVGTASVKETFTAMMRVWTDEGKTIWNGQAYVATTNDLTAAFGAVKSASGLPTGLKFTAKALMDKTYGAIPSNTVYGKPTKAGTFVVALTLPDPTNAKKTLKASFLWKIAPAAAPEFALDTGTAPVVDMKARIVQGANRTFAIAATAGAKVTASGLPSGLKLVQDKATKAYTVQGVASKPGEYRVTFKTVLNGVTTLSAVAFTVEANPFASTCRGYSCARPAAGAAYRLAVAEVVVAAVGTVKLTYTEGKTKYTASVKSFDWDDATGKGTAEGLVLKVSSADKKLGYGDRKATVTFEDRGVYLAAKLDITDANGTSLMPPWTVFLYATVKTTEVPLPASQTYVFRTEDGTDANALATVSAAYDAKKATATFSGKLSDGTAVKATVPVIRVYDEGISTDYSFAPFLVIAKDGTVYCFNDFYCRDGGYVEWMAEDGETTEDVWADYAEYALGDRKFAELVPEAGTFAFGWGSDAETVGAAAETFAFEVTKDKKDKPAGVAIYDAEPQEGEKPLATVTAKVGKATGAVSVSFTSKKGDKAKYAAELVWRGDKLFAGHVTRTWKASEIVNGKSKQVSHTAYGTAEVK